MLTRILFAPESPAPAGTPPPAAPPPAPAPAAPPADVAGAPDNPFKDLDAKFAAAGTPPPAAPAPAAPKPGDAPPPKPNATAPQEPQRTPKELRAEKDRLAGELATEKTAKASLEAKISDYEKKGKDTESLRATLDARDKELEKLQGELRALKQEASPEFKEKYDKPFDRAARYAETTIKGMVKVDGQPADFDKDFVPLYRMPYNAAFAYAKELFGDEVAPAVMQHVAKLQELDFERREAFEDEKKGWASKQKEEEGRIVQQREQFQDAWQRVNTDLQNTVPEYKDPVDDKELSDLRQTGYQIFDAEAKSPRELLWKNAHIRQRTAAYGPNQLLIKRLTAKLAAAEAELAKHKPRQPNPDPSKPGGGEPPPAEKDWATELRETVTG